MFKKIKFFFFCENNSNTSISDFSKRKNILSPIVNFILKLNHSIFKRLKIKRPTIGLITYHSSYNFGSVLQTYATQSTVLKIAKNCAIINYRLLSQKIMYAIENKLQIDKKTIDELGYIYPLKIERAKKYEQFIASFNLTPECNDYESALAQLSKFDIIISGSDQILNKNTGELQPNSYDFMRPYLLDVNTNSRKISFASSFCNMSIEQISDISKYLSKFDYFSIRESTYINNLQKHLNCKIEILSDPVFLLSKRQWIRKFKLQKTNDPKYILYYTVYSYEHIYSKLPFLLKLADETNCNLKIIAPFCNKSLLKFSDKIIECIDYGPNDFLNAIYNSTYVIPESFHGTCFSLIFNKKFLVPLIKHESEIRKIDILKRVKLESHLVDGFDALTAELLKSDIDFSPVNKKIKLLGKASHNYLKRVLRHYE